MNYKVTIEGRNTVTRSEWICWSVSQMLFHILIHSAGFPTQSEQSNRMTARATVCSGGGGSIMFSLFQWRGALWDVFSSTFDAPSMTWRRLKNLKSLLIPASGIVWHFGPEVAPTTYLQLLDSALLVRFMSTLQDPGEKPSAYLHRLQVALNRIVHKGSIQPNRSTNTSWNSFTVAVVACCSAART